MSGKYNTLHNRGRGGYRRRLLKRGFGNGAGPRLTALNELRRRAGLDPHAGVA
jgi:hypothetical protein